MSQEQESKFLLEDDRYCFGCGKENPQGLKLEFRLTDEGMESEFIPTKEHQGFRNVVHGGIMGLVLDEIMVNLAWVKKLHAVSVEFRVRLIEKAQIGERIKLKARIVDIRKKIVLTEAEAYNEAGDVIAQADAKCFRIKHA